MLQAPPSLKPGDLVYLCAPAKAIEEHYIVAAELWLASQGFKSERSKHIGGRHHYFSGTTLERLADFQAGLDHPEAKAIWCVRGGYGSIQLLDGIQWAQFICEPKWLIGFSDICVWHHKIQHLGFQSIHGTMALNVEKNSAAALKSLSSALFGNETNIELPNNPMNKNGQATGTLIGGNLSILFSMLATPESYDFSDAILFIEDLAEHLYHIDRMMHALRKHGALDRIKGLIVGGMTDLEDTDVPFGMSLEELILSHFQYRKIPICFDFPAGHIDDNRAIILGSEIALFVDDSCARMSYLK